MYICIERCLYYIHVYMPQGIVINEILNSALQLFGSHMWCLLSIYHSLPLATEMCKSTEMEQSRQEVHLWKSERIQEFSGAGSPFGVTVPSEPCMHRYMFSVKSCVESLHCEHHEHLRSAVPFSSQVLPLLGHPCFGSDGSWGILGVGLFAARSRGVGKITLLWC